MRCVQGLRCSTCSRKPPAAKASSAQRHCATFSGHVLGPAQRSRLHDERVDISEWWSRIDTQSRAWLIAHNGEAVTPEVMSAITAAGGAVSSDAWWVGQQDGPTGFFLSDAAVDWIEEKANDE
jgi:hypothetical protein